MKQVILGILSVVLIGASLAALALAWFDVLVK